MKVDDANPCQENINTEKKAHPLTRELEIFIASESLLWSSTVGATPLGPFSVERGEREWILQWTFPSIYLLDLRPVLRHLVRHFSYINVTVLKVCRRLHGDECWRTMAVNVAQVNEEAESRLTRSLNLERLHAKAQPYDSPLHEASQKKVPRWKIIYIPHIKSFYYVVPSRARPRRRKGYHG